MSALSVWLAALALALLLGMAAKRKLDQARKSRRGEAAMDERIKARVEATIWPE